MVVQLVGINRSNDKDLGVSSCTSTSTSCRYISIGTSCGDCKCMVALLLLLQAISSARTCDTVRTSKIIPASFHVSTNVVCCSDWTLTLSI